MSDCNLIDHIRQQTEKRYEHLQEASQVFKGYRDIVKQTVMGITVLSVKEGEIDLFDDLDQTPED
jgi:hypothetical protein